MATLNPRYTFPHFIIGASNDLAAASAMAVAAQPGTAYNPFFLHGGTGLGKTHLMQAVAHDLVEQRPGTEVLYQTADEFVRACVEALAIGELEAFRATYDAADALLIDDVHAIAARPDVQAEFTAVFRSLVMRGAQVMLTSDRPPAHVGADAALARSFALGRVAVLTEPSWEHRLAILEALRETRFSADQAAGDLTPQVLELIATHVRSNVRALEGALTRFVAYARLRGSVTVEAARRLLGADAPSDLPAEDPATTAMNAIVESVAAAWKTTPDALRGPSRKGAEPRQVAMFLAREMLDLTLADIGRQFGGRDHSTVLHAVRRVAAALETPGTLASRVENLRAALRAVVTA
jgi:chromosomal replication initiator protein